MTQRTVNLSEWRGLMLEEQMKQTELLCKVLAEQKVIKAEIVALRMDIRHPPENTRQLPGRKY